MTQLKMPTKVAAELVRAELRRRGWLVKDLADRIGVSSRHLSNILAGNVQSRTAEAQVEQVLGRAIWSTEDEFSARQRERAEAQTAAEQENQHQTHEDKHTEH